MIVCGKPLEDTCCASRGHAGRCESVGDYVSRERAAEAAALRAKLAEAEGLLVAAESHCEQSDDFAAAALARAEKAEAEAADAHAAARKNLALRDAAEEHAFDADAAARRRAREHMTAAHAQRDAAVQRAEAAERERDALRNTSGELTRAISDYAMKLSAALSRQRRVAGAQTKLADHLQMLAELLLTQGRASLPGVAESVRRVQTDLRALAAELTEGT